MGIRHRAMDGSHENTPWQYLSFVEKPGVEYASIGSSGTSSLSFTGKPDEVFWVDDDEQTDEIA
jgi:hypothetical protein